MEKPNITPADVGDLQEMLDIRNRHNSDHSKHWCIPYPTDNEDVSTKDGNVYFVAKLQNRMIGYMWMNSEDSFCIENNGVEVFLVVDRGYRGKRFSRKLLDHAVKKAKEKGFERIFAQVKATNNEANALLKGWKKDEKQMGALYSLEIGQNKRK